MAYEKKDYESVKYVAETLSDIYTAMTDYTVSKVEDYGADFQFTGTTSYGEKGFDGEVKTVRKSPFKNCDDQWCSTWTAESWRDMRYCDVPSSSITPDELTGWTVDMTPAEIQSDRTPIPDNIKGKHLYFLNATTNDNTATKAKAHKLFKQGNYYLVYLAKDGMVMFNPRQLKEAFLGYGYYKVSHTTDIGRRGDKHWELKAILDLDKGTYIKKDTPQHLLEK